MPGDNKKKHMTSPRNFFKDILDNMAKLRDETWSDISLKVGYKSLYAHRLVLASHCGYFKTLFLSSFSDSKSEEIDLSSVVDDADILEKVLKYMYYGEIEYEEGEFWEVARLASYFEIETLMTLCESEMAGQANLHNCIEYYMFAHSHGYNYIQCLTNVVIESRFHDYFVFQESTLQLRPGDLKLMLESGMLKYCGNASFLEFLGNWVAKGCTDRYAETAKEILEYLDKEIESDFTVTAHKTPMKSLEDCCNKLESKLGDTHTKSDNDVLESFLKEYKRLVFQVIEAKEIPIDDEEHVLFTLCERKKKRMLLDPKMERKATNKTSYMSSRRSSSIEWDSVYDIFAFRESSNCWYHLNTIESHPRWYHEKVLPFQRNHRDCFVVDKTLIFVTRNSKNAMKFDLEKREWSKLTIKANRERTSSDNTWDDLLSQKTDERLSGIGNNFAVSNNELYVVIVEPVIDLHYSNIYADAPAEINGLNFSICKVDIENGYLTEVARTSYPEFYFEFYVSDLSTYECIRSTVRAKLNGASGEMLVIVHVDTDLGVDFQEYIWFVINIKDGSSHFLSTEVIKQLNYRLHELYIVEKNDAFLVVRHFNGVRYMIIAEYKFLSKVIVFKKGNVEPDHEPGYDSCNAKLGDNVLYNGGGSGLWYFNRNFNYTCDLYYIPLEEKGNGTGDDSVQENTSEGTSLEVAGDKIGCADRKEKDETNAVHDAANEDKDTEVQEHQAKNAKGTVTVDKKSTRNADKTVEGTASECKTANINKNMNAAGNVNDCKSVEGDVSRERNVEDTVNDKRNADGNVNDGPSADDSASDKESIEEEEILDGIPPPFTIVKCVCEANMDKAFISKLKPVKMFLI